MRFLCENDPRLQVWERCESAIEQILCVALFADAGLKAVSGNFSDDRLPELLRDTPMAFLFAQQWIAGFRVDFLVVVADHDGCVLFAIECDGRDYHASESQITYDRRRDNALRRAGCRDVLRFTGSSIVRNARFVAQRICDHLGVQLNAPAEFDWYRLMRDTLAPKHDPRPSSQEVRVKLEFEEELAAIAREDAK